MPVERRRRKICFVALNAYNVLARDEAVKHIGGAEVQQMLLARWLLDLGYEISFVTADHGQSDGAEFGGIRCYKSYGLDRGFPGIRFVHPRWTGLWSALRAADADLYYQRGGGTETGQVALWCRRAGRRFLFGAARDGDAERRHPYLQRLRERWLYRLGLRLADGVIAQTESQRRSFRLNFGLNSAVVRNCAPLDRERAKKESTLLETADRAVVWIGRIAPVKRFEWLLEVARRCQDIHFEVVGAVGQNDSLQTALLGSATQMSNVRLHGEIPHHLMASVYRKGRVLCSTSISEGFPNTFLEAWREGIPVVTTVDPDGVVEKNHLGFVGTSPAELAAGATRLVQDASEYETASGNAKAYFLAHHTVETALPAFGAVVEAILGLSQTGKAA